VDWLDNILKSFLFYTFLSFFENRESEIHVIFLC